MDPLQTQAAMAREQIGGVMTAENAAQILSSRKLITEPGKYTAKVTNVTPFDRTIAGGDTLLTQIVNFAAMTPFNLKEAKRLFKEGKYQEATNQNLTSSRRIGQDFCPKKGDICEIIVDYVALRDFKPWKNPDAIDLNDEDEDLRFPNGRIGQQGLLVIGVQEMKTSAASNVRFSVDDFEGEELDSTLIDPNLAAVENRVSSIDAASARGAGAKPAVQSKESQQSVNVEQPE